jgi:hypothetical protein
MKKLTAKEAKAIVDSRGIEEELEQIRKNARIGYTAACFDHLTSRQSDMLRDLGYKVKEHSGATCTVWKVTWKDAS